MPSPLAVANVKKVIQELEQTAVAVSVMGTTTRKLREMADMVEPIVDALVGSRPDVHRARVDVVRLIHNTRVSSTRAAMAADRLRQLASGLRRVQGLVSGGLGRTEASFRVGPFEVVNIWGYTKPELASAKKVLAGAARQLDNIGLPKLARAKVYLDPASAGGAFVAYQRSDDSLVMDLRRQGVARDVFYALGARLWRQDFSSGDKETWGNEAGANRFQGAFADALTGKKLDPDARARLQMTVGVAA